MTYATETYERCRSGFLGFVIGDVISHKIYSDITAIMLAVSCGLRPRCTFTGFSSHWTDWYKVEEEPFITQKGLVYQEGYTDRDESYYHYEFFYEDCDIYKMNLIREYLSKWYHEGMFTHGGRSMKVENATTEAILKYGADLNSINNDYAVGISEKKDDTLLARVFPAACYLSAKMISELDRNPDTDRNLLLDDFINTNRKLSMLTHSHPVSLMSADIYALAIRQMFLKTDKNHILDGIHEDLISYSSRHDGYSSTLHMFNSLFKKDNLDSSLQTLKNGWKSICTLSKVMDIFTHGNSLEECLKLAETKWRNQTMPAALVGSLAGTYYMNAGENLVRYVEEPFADDDTPRSLFNTHAFLFADHVVKYQQRRTAYGSKLFC